MCIHILIDAKRELSYRRQIDNNNRPIIPGGLRIKDNRNIKIYPIEINGVKVLQQDVVDSPQKWH